MQLRLSDLYLAKRGYSMKMFSQASLAVLLLREQGSDRKTLHPRNQSQSRCSIRRVRPVRHLKNALGIFWGSFQIIYRNPDEFRGKRIKWAPRRKFVDPPSRA